MKFLMTRSNTTRCHLNSRMKKKLKNKLMKKKTSAKISAWSLSKVADVPDPGCGNSNCNFRS